MKFQYFQVTMFQKEKSYWPKDVVLIVLAFNTTQDMNNWTQTISYQGCYPGLQVDIIHFTALRFHEKIIGNFFNYIDQLNCFL